MPRKPRVHVQEAFYHVLARGNQKQLIFYDDEDYQIYLRLTKKYSERYNVELHGYVLMPNHVHFLVRVNSVPLARFMQGIQQTYTQIFNKRHEKVGHLFQGRYKSFYIDKEVYLLELIRYIHLNPVKAGLVKEPQNYRWSSQRNYYHARVGSWVDTSFITSLLATYGGTVIDDYQLMPEELMLPAQFDELREKHNQPSHSTDLKEILTDVAEYIGVSPQVVLGPGRSKPACAARCLFAYVACYINRYRINEVADFLNKDGSTVSKCLRQAEKEWEHSHEVMSRFKGSGPA